MSFITEQEAIEHVEGFDALSASDKSSIPSDVRSLSTST